MSMSTFISDLPGPREENEVYSEEIEHEQEQEFQPEPEKVVEKYIDNSDTSALKGVIKRKRNDWTLESFNRELNIENLLLLCFLFAATMPQLNDFLRRITFVSGYSHFFVTMIKCILLLIAFLVVKRVHPF